MKGIMKKSTLILVFSLVCLNLFSQEISGEFNYKAAYELTYQINSTDESSKKSESMVLYLGDKMSRFSSLGTAVGDSLSENRDKSNKSMAEFQRIRSMIPKTDFDYKIFKNYETGKIQFVEKIFKDKLKYEEPLKLQNWQIKPETKIIAGYSAQSAVTSFAGRNYTAWFTPEIPISDGPYKFNGLPGLILEISDDKNEYHFTLTNFQELEEPVSTLMDYTEYRLAQKTDFLKVKENFKRDPLKAMSNAGIKIGWAKGDEKKAKREMSEKFKKENNPIELE